MVVAIRSSSGYLLLHNKPPSILVAKNTPSYYIMKLQFEQNLVGDDLVFDSIGIKAHRWDGLHSGVNLLGPPGSLSLSSYSQGFSMSSPRWRSISPMGQSQSSGETAGPFLSSCSKGISVSHSLIFCLSRESRKAAQTRWGEASEPHMS